MEQSSLTFDQLKQYIDETMKQSLRLPVSIRSEIEQSAPFGRSLAIDVSCPKMFFCRSSSVDELVRHDVSKYLSFASVKRLRVHSREGELIEIPTSRNAIFQNKSLKLNEKRTLMQLFKSSAPASSNHAITSAANGLDPSSNEKAIDDTLTAIQYLTDVIELQRPELISAIIHGTCLHSRAASKLSAKNLVSRLSTFISSLDQYEQGCPFIVPMYGNSDIPQAFARSAAVNGAVYILSCDEGKLKEELEKLGPQKQPILVESEQYGSRSSLLHGIACIKTRSDFEEVSLVILEPESFEDPPIYALFLPSDQSGNSAVNVCPPGYSLIHLIQASESTELDAFVERMESFISGYEIILQAVWVNEVPEGDPFSMEAEIEEARQMFNRLTGTHPNDPLPAPPPRDRVVDETTHNVDS